jgi:hypothetical protein
MEMTKARMEERFITSEEKLLKVIRKQDKVRQVQKQPKRPMSFDPFKDSTVGMLRFCNRLFILVSIVFIGILVYKFFYLKAIQGHELKVLLENSAPAEGVAGSEVPTPELFPPQQDVAVGRDLFQAPWEKPEDEQAAFVPVANGADLKSVIRLAGIVLDKTNPQAIVEDLVSGETVFLSKDGVIKDATLIDLDETKATFLYQNQRVELTP